MSRPDAGPVPVPGALAQCLQRAVDGLADCGRIHVAAWEPGTAEPPFLLAADQPVAAASMIKLPILAAALVEVAAGRLDLARPTELPERRPGGAGVLHALSSVGRLSLADLLTLMIIVSDNAATNVVIDLVRPDRVNRCCDRAGLRGTRLRRAMMDAEAAERGEENVTTARDLATLLDAMILGDLLPARLRDFARRALERQQVADGLPALLPDGSLVAHKTGQLPGIRHDAGIMTGPGGRQAVVAALVTDIGPAGTRPPGCAPTAPLAAIGLAAWRALDDTHSMTPGTTRAGIGVPPQMSDANHNSDRHENW